MIHRTSILSLLLLTVMLNRSFAQQKDSLQNEVKVNYGLINNNKPSSSNWQLTTLEYKRNSSFGPLIARINYGSRLGKDGLQFEAEAYPSFSRKVYSYAGLGYSYAMPVFPRFRAGYSIFVNLPKAFELEGGFRYLKFDKDIFIYTIGASKYLGNWLINARSFLTPMDNRIEQSYLLTTRKYFGENNQYAFLQAGYGISPDENRNIQLITNARLKTYRISAGSWLNITRTLQAQFEFGYAQIELSETVNNNQVFGTVGLAKKF